VIARFEAERQALAMMDHPNIAKVLEAGETEYGRPFFVMELVRGVKITDYCDQHQLSTAERLKLFGLVCHAVQHAHQKGIIHRDLKPSNILVTLHDGGPLPKVIDFGIAKATQGRLTDRTLFTAFEQFIGTPAYMSPEQAEMSSLDIDTRSDVYSLGVLLYELLTGGPPFESKELMRVGLDEMRRQIREVEPPRPSTRLRTLDQATLSATALHRHIDSPKLINLISGDLDWIVMRCLEKDRTRRYESAASLAQDLQRHLGHEPIVARPASAAYRLQKAIRRNRVAFTAAAVVLVTLVTGIIGTTVGLIRAEKSQRAAEISRQAEAEQRKLAEAAEATAQANERQATSERDRAEQEKRVALAVKDFLQNRLLSQASPQGQADALLKTDDFTAGIKPNPTVRELVDRAAAELTPEKIESQFPNLPLVQAEILRTIGDTYMKLNEGAWQAGIAHLERSRDLYLRQLGADHEQTFATLNRLGVAYMRGRKYREATQTLQQMRDRQMATLGPDHPDTLETLDNLGHTYRDDQRFDDAIQLSQHVYEKRRALFGLEHRDTMKSLNELAAAHLAGGDANKSIPLFEQVRDWRIPKLGPDHPDTNWTLWSLGAAYRNVGKLAEALELHEQVHARAIARFGPGYLLSQYVTSHLASAYRDAGESSKSLALLENMHASTAAAFGPDHISTARAMYYLAHAYRLTAGRKSEELSFFERALKIHRTQLGVNHPDTLEDLQSLAVTYRNANRNADAVPLLEELVQEFKKPGGLSQRRLPANLLSLASAYQAVGRHADALRARAEGIPLMEEALRRQKELSGMDHATTLTAMNNLALAYNAAARPAEGLALLERTVRVARATRGADHPHTLVEMSNLANAYRAAKRPTEALPLAEEVVRRRKSVGGAEDAATAVSMLILAGLYGELKRYADAEPLYRDLLARARRVYGPNTSNAATAQANLAGNLFSQQKFAESEAVFRTVLATREAVEPNGWQTFNVRTRLGEAVAAQNRHEEAEALLLAGYEGMKRREDKMPAANRSWIGQALRCLVRFYTTTNETEKAAKWQQKFDEFNAAQKSDAKSAAEL
jgi:eukaryotic-like serine/threonine-protein kinase